MHKRTPLDPVARQTRFEEDMAAMRVGPKGSDPSKPRQRLREKPAAVGFGNNTWQAKLEEGQTLGDAMQPNFWADHAELFLGQDKKGGLLDKIEVRQLATGLYAELLITEIGRGYVKVKLIKDSPPDSVAVPADSPLTTKWNVSKLSHDVIRASDRTVMATGFQSKAAAAAWIAEHLKAMAA
jgi:hypothetical protein